MTVLQHSNDAKAVIQILYLVLSDCFKDMNFSLIERYHYSMEYDWRQLSCAKWIFPTNSHVQVCLWFIAHTVKMD